MKKFLSLLTLILLCSIGASAQTVIAHMQDFVSAKTMGTMPDVVTTWRSPVADGGIYNFNGSSQYIGGCEIAEIDAAFKGSNMVTVACWVYGVPGSNKCIFGYGDEQTGVKFMMNGTSFKPTTKGVEDLDAGSLSNIAANQWNLIAFAFPGKNCATQKYRAYASATDGQYNTRDLASANKMKDPSTSKSAVGSGDQGTARESYNGMIANLIVIESSGFLKNSKIKELIGDAPEQVEGRILIRPTYVSSNTSKADTNNEHAKKLVDDTGASTKWGESFDNSISQPLWIVVQANNTILKEYALTNGNDTHAYRGRSWKTWTVEGSANAEGPWTEIDNRVDVEMDCSTQYAKNTYSTESNEVAYNYYRITLKAIDGTGANATMQQMGDLQFTVETVESDNDFTLTTFPATTDGTYYVTFTGQATDRPKYLYNDLTQSDGFTLQSNTASTKNNYIWKVESNGAGSFTSLRNGQGSTMKIKSGASKDKTPVLNSLNYEAHNLNANVYYYLKPISGIDITSGHNCLNQSKSGWTNVSGTNVLTTWTSSAEYGDAADNHWDIQSVDMAGITVYNVQVTGADNGYAVYSGQNAADGGFFLVEGTIGTVDAAPLLGLEGSVTIEGNTIKVNYVEYTDPLASYVPDPLPFLPASSVDDAEAAYYYLKEKNTGYYIKMGGDNINGSAESSDAIMMISAGGNFYYIYDVTAQKYLAYRAITQGSGQTSTASSNVYAVSTPNNKCLWRVVKDDNTTDHYDIIPAEQSALDNNTPALNFTGGAGKVINLYKRSDNNCGWQFELNMTANALEAPNVLYATPGAAYMHKLITKSGVNVTEVTGLNEGGLNLQLGERNADTYTHNYKYVHGKAPETVGTYHYNVELDNGKTTIVDLIVSDELQQPKPFMGLLTWNAFQNNISQDIIIKLAEDIVKYDLDDVGYKYMCIDDGWANHDRTNDHMVWNTGKFTDYTQIVSRVHELGLKIGLYSDAGSRTCSQAMPGSYGYETIDATDFVNWGFDLLKYDFCYAGDATEANATNRYKRMGDALHDAMVAKGRNPKDFLFYMCNWGRVDPWKWAHNTGASCWRVTDDTRDTWSDTDHNGGIIQSIARFKEIWAWQGVNRWSDADMMCIGLHGTGYSSNDGGGAGYPDGFNEEEEKTQMALWCMWSSPLTLSNNIDNLDGLPNSLTKKDVTNEHYAKDLEIIKNTRLIALDQDEMGQGAEPIVDADGILVFQKDLANGDVAISITNINNTEKTYTLPFNKISALVAGTNYKLNDLWTGRDVAETYTTESSHSVTLPAHATAIYRVSAGEPVVVADFEGLQEKIDAAKAYTSIVGEGLGKYKWMVTDASGDAIDNSNGWNSTIESYQAYVDDRTASIEQVETYKSEVAAMMNQLVLNMPVAGSFLRLKGVVNNNKYLLGTETKDGAMFEMGSAKDATSIFFYDGHHLLSYCSGRYVGATSSKWIWTTVGGTGSEINFYDASTLGAYRVRIPKDSGSADYVFLYSGNAGGNSADRGAFVSIEGCKDTKYQWTLEDVETLPVDLTQVGALAYASFNAPVAVKIPNGVTAYSAIINGNVLELTPFSSGNLAADMPVVLVANTGDTYNFDIVESGEGFCNRDLLGTIAKQNAASGKTTYVLNKKEGKIGFYTTNIINGFKAYCEVDNNSATSNALSFRFEDVVTAIEAIQSENSGAEIFDLQGRRLSRAQKGMNIINGQKVFVN